MSFNCVIVTPEQQVLDQEVAQVVFPAHDGQVGILTDRAPLLAKLGAGELRLTPAGAGGGGSAGGARRFFVEGGIAQMKDNRLTILTTAAVPADEIDTEAARAELAEATARRVTPELPQEDRQRAIDRARAKLAVAGQR